MRPSVSRTGRWPLIVLGLLLAGPLLPRWAMFFLLGSIGGWLSACGGAFKDAPIEGFHTFKFFRSPFLAGSYGLLLSLFTGSYLVAALGDLRRDLADALGMERLGDEDNLLGAARLDRLVERIDDLHGNHRAEILGVVIVFRHRRRAGETRSGWQQLL